MSSSKRRVVVGVVVCNVLVSAVSLSYLIRDLVKE